MKPKTKVSEVARLLHKYHIHGLPVVDEGKLIGIITETDFFLKDKADLYLPSFIDYFKANDHLNVPGVKSDEVNMLLNATAEDIMSKNCATIKADANITEAMEFFKNRRFFSIPVVNDENNIKGIITIADIIKLI